MCVCACVHCNDDSEVKVVLIGDVDWVCGCVWGSVVCLGVAVDGSGTMTTARGSS